MVTANLDCDKAGVPTDTFRKAVTAEGFQVFGYVPSPIPTWARMNWQGYAGPPAPWLRWLEQAKVDYRVPAWEVPARPNGGVGVQLLALPEGVSLAAVAATDGKSLVVSGIKRKNRAEATLDAKQLPEHMGKRAQRGKVCDAGFRPDRIGS